jgi:hypothetical protein
MDEFDRTERILTGSKNRRRFCFEPGVADAGLWKAVAAQWISVFGTTRFPTALTSKAYEAGCDRRFR